MLIRFRKAQSPAAPQRRDRLVARARRVIIGAVLFLLGLQIASALLIDCRFPELCDPEYRIRLEKLRARLAEHPDRPLVLMLGSSRVLNGFQPQQLNRLATSAGLPVNSFNFGLLCAGPLRQYMALQHLLADNIRPQLLLLEMMPPLYNEPGKDRFCDENWFYIPPLTLADMARLHSHFARPHRLYLPWLVSRLVPGCEYQQRIFLQLATGCLPPPEIVARDDKIDAWGWMPTPTPIVTPEEQRCHTEAAHRQYAHAFPEFRLGSQPCRLLCDMLEACRREHIAVRLIRMPEAGSFRGWYTPSAEAQIEAFLAGLSQRFGVETVNARQWIADSEFWDGHHLLPPGAAVFTERLGHEVILPWLRQSSSPVH